MISFVLGLVLLRRCSKARRTSAQVTSTGFLVAAFSVKVATKRPLEWTKEEPWRFPH